MHGQIDLVGIVSRADGGTAARFADSVAIDLDSQKQADDFVRVPWHYENQFPIVAGKLSFALLVSGGDGAPVRLSAPLEVDAWNASQFAIGSIALCKQISAADNGSTAQTGPILEGRTPLAAGGKQFVPASISRFRRSEPAYFYTEIYEPLLAGSTPPCLTLELSDCGKKHGRRESRHRDGRHRRFCATRKPHRSGRHDPAPRRITPWSLPA